MLKYSSIANDISLLVLLRSQLVDSYKATRTHVQQPVQPTAHLFYNYFSDPLQPAALWNITFYRG